MDTIMSELYRAFRGQFYDVSFMEKNKNCPNWQFKGQYGTMFP